MSRKEETYGDSIGFNLPSSVIHRPTKFLIPNVMYGEEVCIHLLPPDYYLISLNFDEFGNDVLEVEKGCDPTTRSKIYKKITPIINKIMKSSSNYKIQSYLFIGNDKKILLVNYSINNAMLNYSKSLTVAAELKLELAPVAWEGTYTRQVEYAFCEDIIVQQK